MMSTHAAIKQTAALTAAFILFLLAARAQQPAPVPALDVTTDKARYAPQETAIITLTVEGATAQKNTEACLTLESLGKTVACQCNAHLTLRAGKNELSLRLQPPPNDFQGYRLHAQLRQAHHELLAEGFSALDVSSNWAKFPRYGYIANYDASTPAVEWIRELNRYHINGLLFYDVQNKHHMPVPPEPALPAQWPDVAGRTVNRDVVLSLLAQAKERHMTTMVYNASYAAYQNAFTDGSGVQLQWATWPSATTERSAANVKSLLLPTGTGWRGWSTPALLYMNQSDTRWQSYLFAQMNRLFAMLPFDGWHIDSFGDAEAWNYEGKKIDFVAGFPDFVNAAHQTLQRPVVLNTVSGAGQEGMANSAAEFVYSELWLPDHPTYRSILQSADSIHRANPNKAIVFAAYMQNGAAEKLTLEGKHAAFNLPGLLITDAAIFASGASHIELGDGDRMLSRPYFPDDQVLTLTPQDRVTLRDYYDFLVAYENNLRDKAEPADTPVEIGQAPASVDAHPGSIWTIARKKDADIILHLINLTSVKDSSWRNDGDNIAIPLSFHQLRIRVIASELANAGWASPDVDHGAWHKLPLCKIGTNTWEIVLPELRVWSMVILSPNNHK
jgi:dextranase